MSVQRVENTSTGFTADNTVLAAGSIGQESDTGRLKIGDGSTAWNDADYFVPDQSLEELVGLHAGVTAASAGVGAGGVQSAYLDFGEMVAPATFDDLGSGSYAGSIQSVEDFWGSPQIGLTDLEVGTATPGGVDIPVGLYYLTGLCRVVFADTSQDGKFFFVEPECDTSDENSGGWIGFCVSDTAIFSFSLITAMLPASPGDLTVRFHPVVPNGQGSGDYSTAIASIGGSLTISKLPSAIGA